MLFVVRKRNETSNMQENTNMAYWQRLAIWTLLYAAAFWIVPYIESEFEHTPVTWPPVGIALGAFVHLDRAKRWITASVLAVTGLIAASLTGNGVLLAAALVTGDMIAAGFGAWFYVRRLQSVSQRDAVQASLWLLFAAFCVAFVLATVFSSLNVANSTEFWASMWSIWFGSIMLGIILAGTPLIYLDRNWRSTGRDSEIFESLFLLFIVVGQTLYFFLASEQAGNMRLFWLQMVIPFIVLAALRCGASVAIALVFIISNIAAFATINGIGPIATLPAPKITQIIWLQAFFIVAGSVLTLVTAAISDKMRSSTHDAKQTAILAAIENTSLDAIISINATGRMLSVNPAAERLFGYIEAELLGKNVKMLMPSHFRDQHDGYLGNYIKTGERKIIGIGRVVAGERRDGSTFPIELSVGEAIVNEERIFVGTIRDLSEIEREHKRVQELQADLFHVSRLSEMGQIAASLAHEVNQPLAAIMNYAQAAQETIRQNDAAQISQASGNSRISEILSKISVQSGRAADIIKRLRAFIEKRSVERHLENLNALIEEALALALVGPAGRGVRVRTALSLGNPMVFVDRVQIQQVLVNLVRNAIDSMEGLDRREISIASFIEENQTMRVSVSDIGRGISEDIGARLFMAFVSTKEHGMGVGLSICKAIIDDHDGRIWFTAGEGGGTVFHFTLPLAGTEKKEQSGRA